MTSTPPGQSTEYQDQRLWFLRVLTWAAFLALLYLLRDFFLIGLLTFLTCFFVRRLVGFLARHLAPHRPSRSLELFLTLSVFGAICLSIYGVGKYFVPPLIRQGKSLLMQLQNSSVEGLQNCVLANTVGRWQFQHQFGAPSDDRYQQAFHDFQQSGRQGEGLYREFPQLNSRLRAEFDSDYVQALTHHLQVHGVGPAAVDWPFEQWFLQVKAPQLYHDKSEYYLARWEAQFATPAGADELNAIKQRPDYEDYRDRQIGQLILTAVRSDPVEMAECRNEWAHALSIREWAEFRKSTEYNTQFKAFYEKLRADDPVAAPLDYSFFQSLAAAYAKGKDAFLATVQEHYQDAHESLEHRQHDFETATQLDLGQQWWATSHVADWVRDHAQQDGPRVMEAVVPSHQPSNSPAPCPRAPSPAS
jgi:hypothetical protein